MRKILMLVLLCISLGSTHVFAQMKTVTGKVTDEGGNPVVGATVQARGSKGGTTTDGGGNFTLRVPQNVKSVAVSSVNFTEQQVSVGNSGNVAVQLKATSASLSEVVVVGYGTQRRSEMTSAVAKVSGDKVANVPLGSVDQILQGKVAGLQSVNFSGQPGANQQIRIRGVGSYSLSSQPLYVIDGIIINSGDLSRLTTTSNVLANINPNDIDNISVLKDAAATAIYGSQGSNGVIIITTKRGKAGKSKINFTAEVGTNKHGEVPDAGKPIRSADWLTLFKEAYLNSGYSQAVADAAAANYGDGTVDADWLSLLTRSGMQEQYNLSLSGGDEKSKVYVSGGYFNQQANVIGSALKRYSSIINVDHTISRKFSVSLNIQPSYTRELAPTSNSSAFSNPIQAFYFLRPLQNPYNADGSLNIGTATKDFSSSYNPLYIVANDVHTLDNFQLNSKAEVKYNIWKGLSFTSRIGEQYNNIEEYQFNNALHGDGKGVTGRGYSYYTRYFLYDWVNQFDYTATIKSFRLNATAGYEALTSKLYTISTQATNFPTPALVTQSTASTPVTASSTPSEYSFLSTFARVNLSFKEKYSIQGSLRRDGSSQVSSNNQYGVFPSVGLAWNIAKEDFLSGISSISDFKLRGSYGKAGNKSGLAYYGWRQTYGYGLNYNGSPGGGFNTIGNADLEWETSKQTDIGVDASFLQNRIGFTFDWYKKDIDGLIFAAPTSQTIGFSSITKNIGSMQNKGIELTINATPVKTKDFSWDLSFNISHNHNQFTKIAPTSTGYTTNGSFLVQPGHDFYEFYLKQWAGVDPATGSPMWYLDTALTKTTTSYTTAPLIPTGKSASPKVFGGFSNTFTYKGFSLTADINYNYGNYVQDAWAAYLTDEINPSYGKYSYTLNRWQNPGDITDVPKLVYGGTTTTNSTSTRSNSSSTRFLYKGDFVRLRNIQIGYTAPASLIQHLHLTALNLYVRGTNLATKIYDKNIPFDPEQGVASQSNLNFFQNKTLTVGLNIGL